jgi:hypothetical protein
MEQNSEEYYSLNNIIGFTRDIYRHFLKKWWLFLITVFIGAGLGLTYSYLQKPKYEAVCTFILEENQGSVGGLSSIASQFGFDLAGLNGGGSIFAGDNILDILKSRNIIQNVLLSKVDSTKGGESESLADLFLDFNGWKKNWAKENEFKDINLSNYRSGTTLSLKQDSVLNLIYEYILKKSLVTDRLNKKGSIIKVSIVSQNQYFAKLMTDRLIEESRTFYIKIKTNTAQQNVQRLERKSDSLLALLNYNSYAAANAVVLDANPALRTLSVPSELKLRDKAVLGTLYAELTKNLELSRISLNQQTPVIQVLDRPIYPLEDKRKGRLLLVIVFSFVGALLVALVEIMKFIIAKSQQLSL